MASNAAVAKELRTGNFFSVDESNKHIVAAMVIPINITQVGLDPSGFAAITWTIIGAMSTSPINPER